MRCNSQEGRENMAFYQFARPSERLGFPVEMCAYLPEGEGVDRFSAQLISLSAVRTG